MKKSKENRCQCCNKSLIGDFRFVFGDEGKHHNIATLLYEYIKKSLNEKDGLNYAICDPCWQQLIQYNEFKQKCIQAHEVSSDDSEDDAVKIENDDDFLFQETEFLDEYQNNSEIDEMNVEYLDENDLFDEKNECIQNVQITEKVLPFDFTSVLVKPIFALENGNFIFPIRVQTRNREHYQIKFIPV